MTTETVTIVNVETGEVIQREMNAEELAQYEVDQAAQAERLAAEEQARLDAEAKAVAKAALLAKLGITEDEAKLLLL